MPELLLPFFYLVTSKNSDKRQGRHSESKSRAFFSSCSFTATCSKEVDQRARCLQHRTDFMFSESKVHSFCLSTFWRSGGTTIHYAFKGPVLSITDITAPAGQTICGRPGQTVVSLKRNVMMIHL